MYFKIGSTDFSHLVSGLKVGYETLVADTSGRNAAGYMFFDKIAVKRKVYVTLRHTTAEEMRSFLGAITANDSYTFTVSYLDPKTQAMHMINCYAGTPEPEYYTISDKTIYKPMSINFIEL